MHQTEPDDDPWRTHVAEQLSRIEQRVIDLAGAVILQTDAIRQILETMARIAGKPLK